MDQEDKGEPGHVLEEWSGLPGARGQRRGTMSAVSVLVLLGLIGRRGDSAPNHVELEIQ